MCPSDFFFPWLVIPISTIQPLVTLFLSLSKACPKSVPQTFLCFSSFAKISSFLVSNLYHPIAEAIYSTSPLTVTSSSVCCMMLVAFSALAAHTHSCSSACQQKLFLCHAFSCKGRGSCPLQVNYTGCCKKMPRMLMHLTMAVSDFGLQRPVWAGDTGQFSSHSQS